MKNSSTVWQGVKHGPSDNAEFLTHAAAHYAPLVEALVGVIVGEYGMRAMRGEFGGPPTGYSTCPAWIQRAVKVINDAGEGV